MALLLLDFALFLVCFSKTTSTTSSNHLISLDILDLMGSNDEHGTDINLKYRYDTSEKDGFLFNTGHAHNISSSPYINYFEFDWGITHHSNNPNGLCAGDVVPREAVHAKFCNHSSLDTFGTRFTYRI